MVLMKRVLRPKAETLSLARYLPKKFESTNKFSLIELKNGVSN